MRRHCPRKSGYFFSSCACAPAIAAASTNATATAQAGDRKRMNAPTALPPAAQPTGHRLRLAAFRLWLGQGPHCPEIGLPSLNLVFIRAQAPPGAPLRSGSIVNTNSSPGLRVLADIPSRARMLGDGPSRFHTVLLPSLPLTSTRMKLCGLV